MAQEGDQGLEIPAFIRFLVNKEVLWDYYKARGFMPGVFIAEQEGGGDEVYNLSIVFNHPIARYRGMDSNDEEGSRYSISDEITGIEPKYVEYDDLLKALKELFSRIAAARVKTGKPGSPDLDDLLYEFYGIW